MDFHKRGCKGSHKHLNGTCEYKSLRQTPYSHRGNVRRNRNVTHKLFQREYCQSSSNANRWKNHCQNAVGECTYMQLDRSVLLELISGRYCRTDHTSLHNSSSSLVESNLSTSQPVISNTEICHYDDVLKLNLEAVSHSRNAAEILATLHEETVVEPQLQRWMMLRCKQNESLVVIDGKLIRKRSSKKWDVFQIQSPLHVKKLYQLNLDRPLGDLKLWYPSGFFENFSDNTRTCRMNTMLFSIERMQRINNYRGDEMNRFQRLLGFNILTGECLIKQGLCSQKNFCTLDVFEECQTLVLTCSKSSINTGEGEGNVIADFIVFSFFPFGLLGRLQVHKSALTNLKVTKIEVTGDAMVIFETKCAYLVDFNEVLRESKILKDPATLQLGADCEIPVTHLLQNSRALKLLIGAPTCSGIFGLVDAPSTPLLITSSRKENILYHVTDLESGNTIPAQFDFIGEPERDHILFQAPCEIPRLMYAGELGVWLFDIEKCPGKTHPILKEVFSSQENVSFIMKELVDSFFDLTLYVKRKTAPRRVYCNESIKQTDSLHCMTFSSATNTFILGYLSVDSIGDGILMAALYDAQDMEFLSSYTLKHFTIDFTKDQRLNIYEDDCLIFLTLSEASAKCNCVFVLDLTASYLKKNRKHCIKDCDW